MATARETREVHTLLGQAGGAIAFAASGTPVGGGGTARPMGPPSSARLTAANALAAGRQASSRPPAATCQQCLTLTFYFDGTGNNIDADVGTMQHSNVARLFQGRLEDDASVGRFSYYIPGIGTYFPAIGDDGGTSRGLGFGHMGQARLDWAFARFDEAVARAEARAQNPTNKITGITVNVFGFSRGATLARAFVRDLAARCSTSADGSHRLSRGNHPIRIGFLGIFDTVASVGLPMSANNTPGATSTGMYSTATTLSVRARSPQTGVIAMAFGDPGADPAPGSYDGHASWADGLAVPSMVERCVHMTAGHEMRNSFPLDSALDGHRYPPSVTEMVYPGAHSNVGGGYQPGEGARSPHYAEVISLVTLHVMHGSAREAGVPLLPMSELRARSTVLQRSFALDPEGAQRFGELQDHWRHYTNIAGSGGRHVGNEILNHLHWYNRWRFFNIRRNQDAARQGRPGPDAATAAQREQQFRADRTRLQRDVQALRREAAAAQQRAALAEQNLRSAQMAQARFGLPVPASLRSEAAEARDLASQANDRYLSENAKLSTFADDSALPANLAAYDAQLLADAQAILAHHQRNPHLPLRPHYRNLLQAYKDEFVHGTGLRDEKVIAFFDRYIHDSLAGFAKDATLPSDPRVVYAGGDNKLRFAATSTGPQQQTA